LTSPTNSTARRGDFFGVLEAQKSLYSSEDQLVQSQRNAAANLIGLYRALGGGWE
jgi:outer membrane protein TolC